MHRDSLRELDITNINLGGDVIPVVLVRSGPESKEYIIASDSTFRGRTVKAGSGLKIKVVRRARTETLN